MAVRNLRRAARHELEALEKDGDISTDELERAEKELEKITHEQVDGDRPAARGTKSKSSSRSEGDERHGRRHRRTTNSNPYSAVSATPRTRSPTPRSRRAITPARAHHRRRAGGGFRPRGDRAGRGEPSRPAALERRADRTGPRHPRPQQRRGASWSRRPPGARRTTTGRPRRRSSSRPCSPSDLPAVGRAAERAARRGRRRAPAVALRVRRHTGHPARARTRRRVLGARATRPHLRLRWTQSRSPNPNPTRAAPAGVDAPPASGRNRREPEHARRVRPTAWPERGTADAVDEPADESEHEPAGMAPRGASPVTAAGLGRGRLAPASPPEPPEPKVRAPRASRSVAQPDGERATPAAPRGATWRGRDRQRHPARCGRPGLFRRRHGGQHGHRHRSSSLLATAEGYAAFRRAQYHPATLLGLVAVLSLMIETYNKGVAALPLVLVLLVAGSFIWYLAGVEPRPTRSRDCCRPCSSSSGSARSAPSPRCC